MSMSTKLEKDRTYVKPRLTCGPGKTKQSFAAQVNVNNIVARYHKTGMLDHVRENPGIFADVSQIDDYPGMVAKLRFAQESFEQLPSALRKRFRNDPAELIAFVSDDSNRDEAVKLGLVPKAVKELPAPVVTDAIAPVVPAKAEKTKSSSKAEAKPKD